MCKVRGMGIDLCGVARMAELLGDDRFLSRWFTPEEAAYIRSRGASAAQSMAGIFAAKEAFAKAVGAGLAIPMREIKSETSVYAYHSKDLSETEQLFWDFLMEEFPRYL